MSMIDTFAPVVTEGIEGTILNDDAVVLILNKLSRLDDFAVAALDRSENDPVMQSLLSEIREKVQTIHGLFER